MTRCLMLGALFAAGLLAGSTAMLGGQRPLPMSAAEHDAMFKTNNNWGRWGKDDKLGTLNLITDARRKAAASLVRTGVAVSLAHDLSTEATPDNPEPLLLQFGPTLRRDTLGIAYHGTFVTHLDALCHQVYGDRMYNDRPSTLNTTSGCAMGVEQMKNGIVTRGILIDVPRLRGVRWLEPSDSVRPEEIVAWERMAGVRIGPGDAVIVRTGRWARRATMGPWKASGNAAGLHVSALPLIHERDIALLGGDTTADTQSDPPLVEGDAGRAPYHTAIAWLGMPLIDNFDPEALAEVAARERRWEFMFVVAPLAIPGGTGSPVNPLAIF